jgi:hypothetical protein
MQASNRFTVVCHPVSVVIVGWNCMLLVFLQITLWSDNFFFQLASIVLCGPWSSLMDFSIHRNLVRLLGWGISPTQGLYRHRTTQHRNTQTHIHAPGKIRTCDLNVQAVVDSTCLRPLGYWDRLQWRLLLYICALGRPHKKIVEKKVRWTWGPQPVRNQPVPAKCHACSLDAAGVNVSSKPRILPFNFQQSDKLRQDAVMTLCIKSFLKKYCTGNCADKSPTRVHRTTWSCVLAVHIAA